MRRSTGIYILLLVILAGLYYYLNNRSEIPGDQDSIPTQAAIEYLFSSADGPPNRILIKSKTGEIVELARDEENAWVLTKPVESPADQGSVEAATGQISTIRILDHLSDIPKEAVGLDEPEYTFEIQFTGDVERIIHVGVLTPTGSGYYARRDNEIETLILSNTGFDSLIEFLTTPPYLATETPLPSPLEADFPDNGTATPPP